MKIPESIRVNTGDDGPVYEAINQFFGDVVKEVEVKKGRREGPSQFEIRVNHLCTGALDTPLNDSVHMLLYQQRVVAVVTETRTEGNYVQFDFFKNTRNLT